MDRFYRSVLVRVSACKSVTTPASTSLVSTLKIRYVEVSLRLFLDFNSWIFEKSLRSKVMAYRDNYRRYCSDP